MSERTLVWALGLGVLTVPLSVLAVQGSDRRGHHVQLAGYPDRASFASDSVAYWEGLSRGGYSSSLIIGSFGSGKPVGDWSYAKNATTVAPSAKTALAALEAEGAKVNRGQNLVMYVADHGVSNNGWSGNGGPGSPAKTGVVMSDGFSSFVSWPDLVSATKKRMPKGSSLKIVAGPCFSGGVHSAVAQVPQACAISQSDYLSVGYSSPSPDNQNLDEAVAAQLRDVKYDPDKSGRSSLMEAYLYALEHDFEESGIRAGISSFDFVDSVLKEGPYSDGRVALDDWRSELQDGATTCSNAPFGPLLINASNIRDLDAVLKKLEAQEAAADWNEIPKELRDLYESATGERGFFASVFGPRDLKAMRNANSSLEEKARSAEIAAIRREWKDRDNPASSPVAREYHDVMERQGGRRLLELNQQIEQAENQYSELHSEYQRANAKLRSAWFFVESRAKAATQANDRRLESLEALNGLKRDRDEVLTREPRLAAKVESVQKARAEHLGALQRSLKERYSKVERPDSRLASNEARVAVLRERMVRVARFMRQATPEQKSRYLSLLQCELEDI